MQLSIPLPDILGTNIDNDDLNSFASNGFLLMRKACPPELVNRLQEWTRKKFWNSKGELISRRSQDEWLRNDDIRTLALLPNILDKLQELYGRVPIPFQTLNFPVGTEQRTHSDCIHFHTFPQRFMCGVWVALEKVDESNGGLHYYPGSHRLPVIECHDVGISGLEGGARYHLYEDSIQELISVAGLSKQVVRLDAGDALIWAANLLHGGDPIKLKDSTRMSQVTHYYFEGCRFYTPLHSDIPSGNIALREHVRNIQTNNIAMQPPLYKGFALFRNLGSWLDRKVFLLAKKFRKKTR